MDMSAADSTEAEENVLEINLRQPGIAALCAWLVPGAGHVYQGRIVKGLLFAVCVLGTYGAGFAIGEGKVVYAAWEPEKDHRRWQFICQLGVGLPALPAAIQGLRYRQDKPLLWNGFMAPPEPTHDLNTSDALSDWNLRLNSAFEMGTLYTVIAGLLNILAIYDAFSGPMIEVVPQPRE